MDQEIQLIEVGVADVKVSASPNILITYALGSCVGIVLYDPVRKIGALGHPMLPDITKSVANANPAKFVNSILEYMLSELASRGCQSSYLKAKLFGGATLFAGVEGDRGDFFNIGPRNIEMSKALLNHYGIELAAEDTGGNFGRTILVNLANGKVRMKTIYHGEKDF